MRRGRTEDMERTEDWHNSHQDLADAIAEAVAAKVADALAPRWKEGFEALSQDVQALRRLVSEGAPAPGKGAALGADAGVAVAGGREPSSKESSVEAHEPPLRGAVSDGSIPGQAESRGDAAHGVSSPAAEACKVAPSRNLKQGGGAVSHTAFEQRIVNYMLAKELNTWNDDCAQSLRAAGPPSTFDSLPEATEEVPPPGRQAPSASRCLSVLPCDGPVQAWGYAGEPSCEALPGLGAEACTAGDPQDPDLGDALAKSSSRRSSMFRTGEALPRTPSMKLLRQANNDFLISASLDAIDADAMDALAGSPAESEGWSGRRSRIDHKSARGACCEWLAFVVPRVCGLLPWSLERKRLGLAYQMSLILVMCLAVGAVALQDTCSSASCTTDTLLGLGSLFSLMVGFWTRQELIQCSMMLADNGAVEWAWDSHLANWVELAGIWLVAVGIRIRTVLAEETASLPSALQFVLSSFILISMTAYFRSIAKTLQSSMDKYCCNTFMRVDLERAEREWNVVQALIRNSCHGIEHCFVLTQVIGATALVACVSSLNKIDSFDSVLGELLSRGPGALVGLGISKTMLHVASLTDMCEKVPSLFAFLPTLKALDVNRMHLVQHIMHSQTGFYAFHVCLSSTVVLKLTYLTCVLAVAIGTNF